AGADTERVLQGISDRLTPAIVAMGRTHNQGTRGADYAPCGPRDLAFTARLADLLAERDDALLADYVLDESRLSYYRLTAALAAQSRRGLVHPVFAGSAMTGAGVDHLTAGSRPRPPPAGPTPAA